MSSIDPSTLKLLDLNNDVDCRLYISQFQEIQAAYVSRHNGQVGANYKPFSILYPWAYEGYRQARERLGLNYFQMPYEDAKKIHRDLPHRTWLKGRTKYLAAIASGVA
jgi:hypothetical protein